MDRFHNISDKQHDKKLFAHDDFITSFFGRAVCHYTWRWAKSLPKACDIKLIKDDINLSKTIQAESSVYMWIFALTSCVCLSLWFRSASVCSYLCCRSEFLSCRMNRKLETYTCTINFNYIHMYLIWGISVLKNISLLRRWPALWWKVEGAWDSHNHLLIVARNSHVWLERKPAWTGLFKHI